MPPAAGGYPPDPLEMRLEEEICGCWVILGRASVPRHKFGAIAKSGFDIIFTEPQSPSQVALAVFIGVRQQML